MNPLARTTAHLGALMTTDPTLALCRTAAWLEPWRIDGWEFSEDDTLMNALDICRALFQDLYAEAVNKLWKGEHPNEVDWWISISIGNRLGVDLCECEGLGWGIPLECWGIDWYGYDGMSFSDTHTSLVPIYEWLAGKPLRKGGFADPDFVSPIMGALRASLKRETHWQARDAHTLLCWMCNDTGNSLADYTRGEYNETGEQLGWNEANLIWYFEAKAESDEINAACNRGLDLIKHDKAWNRAFRKNAAEIRAILEQHPWKKGKLTDARRPRLNWPGSAHRRNPRTAQDAA